MIELVLPEGDIFDTLPLVFGRAKFAQIALCYQYWNRRSLYFQTPNTYQINFEGRALSGETCDEVL